MINWAFLLVSRALIFVQESERFILLGIGVDRTEYETGKRLFINNNLFNYAAPYFAGRKSPKPDFLSGRSVKLQLCVRQGRKTDDIARSTVSLMTLKSASIQGSQLVKSVLARYRGRLQMPKALDIYRDVLCPSENVQISTENVFNFQDGKSRMIFIGFSSFEEKEWSWSLVFAANINSV